MDWFRSYHGMPIDPKWITVARKCGGEVTPGHVVAVWVALLDHASQSKPRGFVGGFQADDIAASYGWPDDLVQCVVAGLEAKGLIIDGCLAAWDKRQPEKTDRTASERKKRQREKQKQSAGKAPPDAGAGNDSHDVSRRDTRDSHESRHVTPLEEKEQSNCDFSDSSKQACNSSLKSITTRSVREQARAFINASEVWAWIASAGIPANIGTRAFNRHRIAEWLQQGLTDQHLDEAMKRAQKRRADDNSLAPVNLGFLACLTDEVLSGAPSKTKTGGGYERGDELSREFADVR